MLYDDLLTAYILLKNNMAYFLLLVTFFLLGCEKNPETSSQNTPVTFSYNWQTIKSRDDGTPTSRFPLYTAKVPSDWIRKDPSPTDSIEDTMKPLTEFLIKENNETVRITIHNFPEQRIPPTAQIQRWKNQFIDLDPSKTHTTEESHNGFVGLRIETEGMYNQNPTKLIGWAMQLAPEYYDYLSNEDKSFIEKQELADYTIKAIGSPILIDKHRDAILNFGQSFGLIQELPQQQ